MLRLIARLLLLAAVSITFVFGSYEIIERTWLLDAGMQLRHRLYVVRGVVSSLLVGTLVGWSVLRAAPSMFTTVLSHRDGPPLSLRGEEERLEQYNRWLVQMRWLAIVVAATLVFVVVSVVNYLPLEVRLPLGATIACLAFLNVVVLAAIRRKWRLRAVLSLQMYLDLVLLMMLLHFSGGIENPLWLFAVFHVILGGILLPRKHSYAMAGFATILFVCLATAGATSAARHYTLQIFPHDLPTVQASGSGHSSSDAHRGAVDSQHAAHDSLYVASRLGLFGGLLFITAYFVTTLAERARSDERQLAVFAERALGERQLLERAIETTGTGLRVIDRDLRYRWINKRWQEWFGGDAEAEPSSLMPRASWEGSPAETTLRDGAIRVTERTARTGEPNEQANARIFQITTAPLLDVDGNITQVVELGQEITEQKNLQAQIVQAGKMAAVGELAGHVVHEVNNPAAIVGAKGRLLLSYHSEEMSEWVCQEVTKMTEAADRIARIAQGLLSYCQRSVGTRAPVDIRLPIRQALGLVDHRAREGGVVVEEKLSDELPLIDGNAGELEQVFLNLFLNALDAMKTGGSLTVCCRSEQVALERGPSFHVVVEVRDTGGGIPLDTQARILDPFVTTKKGGLGTGLGLSICLGLVRGHGGDIGVRSQPGEGSVFTIRLPASDHGPSDATHA